MNKWINKCGLYTLLFSLETEVLMDATRINFRTLSSVKHTNHKTQTLCHSRHKVTVGVRFTETESRIRIVRNWESMNGEWLLRVERILETGDATT